MGVFVYGNSAAGFFFFILRFNSFCTFVALLTPKIVLL